jgi:WD40 repeat protein
MQNTNQSTNQNADQNSILNSIQNTNQSTEIELPTELNPLLTLLVQILRSTRCLLILDNAETILRSGEYSGFFYPEYEGYGEILKRLAELPHQSCLLITSRESPKGLMAIEGATAPVRALRLSGITEAEARQILKAKGKFSGSPDQWQQLTRCYAGNPLALKVVATTIQELFDGSIAEFLAEGTTVFEDIRYLLQQQFDRLPQLEQGIMHWLAIHREPITIPELQADLLPAVTKSKLMDAIGNLRWRSLIDKTVNAYTQQPVIMEYVTERLIDAISQEMIGGEFDLLIRHALIKAPIKDYVRESQIRLILQPLIDRLSQTYRSRKELEHHLTQIVEQLQEDYQTAAGYAVGNILNLFRQLGTDLTDRNFSHLAIWQAYLQDVPLHGVDFSQSDISRSVFAQTLGSILAVAFSPNGELVASSDAEGELCLWQASDGKQLFTCRGDRAQWGWSVAFSPDSQILASSSEDQMIRLWDVETGECLRELAGHTHWVYTVTFNPTLPQLASSSEDGTVKLWDLETGDCLQTLAVPAGGVRTIAFSPDGQRLAAGSADGSVHVWHLPTSSVQILSHLGGVRSVAFSPDGRWLATAGDDPMLWIWEVQTGECWRWLENGSRTWSIAFSPDSQFLLSGSDDRLRLWEIHTDEPIRSFTGHSGLVLTVHFSPDGKTAVSGSDDQTIKFWEVDTGRCLKTLKGHNNWVWSVDFSPNGAQLASGNEDRKVRLWQVNTGHCLHELAGHQGRIWSVAYSPDGRILASGSDDQTVRFWQVDREGEPRCVQTLRGQTGAVRLVLFSPSGDYLATNSGDCEVKLWEAKSLLTADESVGRRSAGRTSEWVSGQCRAVISGDAGRVFAIAFSLDDQWIFTGNEDGSVQIWEIQTGTCLKVLQGHQKPVQTIAIHPNGSLLASGSHDETVRLWDLTHLDQSGQGVELAPAVGRVLTLDFNSAGLLAIGGSNHQVSLWDASTQTLIGCLDDHLKAVQTLRFSADDRYLATGSEDEMIRLWSFPEVTQQGRLPQTIQVLQSDRPYEGLNLTGVTGLTAAQKSTLKLLGAIEL